jgi:hypothetical protein
MMDTAKVDIRKLQVLNDRVNQCLDALNDVRFSVHGLSHTSPAGQGIPGINPLAQDPRLSFAWGAGAAVNPLASSLSHTGAIGPIGTGLAPQVAGVGIPFGAINPYTALSHSGVGTYEALARPMWSDPLLTARVAQTFPYAFVSIPPVVTIY